MRRAIIQNHTHKPVRRALVVDDSPLLRKLHARMMEELGYEVVAAGDGLQALKVAAQNVFDVILMDCEMPIMDGLMATRVLRKAKLMRAGKSLIIGVTSSQLRHECINAGMNAFLSKPLCKGALVQALQHNPSVRV